MSGYSSGKIKSDMARTAAVLLLHGVLEENKNINQHRDYLYDKYELSREDRALATAIYSGSITFLVNIDEVVKSLSHRPVEKIDPIVLSILRIGVWQIMFADKIPVYAAVNESVKIGEHLVGKSTKGFINGILREAAANKEQLLNEYFASPKKFHLKCNMIPELAGYFKKWFGEEEGVKICRSLNEIPAVSIRVNTIKSSKDEVENILQENKIEFMPGAFMPESFRILTGNRPLNELPGFNEGKFTVQDEGAMLVSLLAVGDINSSDINRDMNRDMNRDINRNINKDFPDLSQDKNIKIVDVCAAPGGKTCHMADIIENRGRIYAFDLNSSRTSLIEENIRRLGVLNTIVKIGDAREITQKDIGGEKADIVLADVPCSGLGVLRRKPDIRHKITHENMQFLYPLQREILKSCGGLVKPGGILVYSTCTLNPEENRIPVMEFIEEQKGNFALSDFSELIPEGLLREDKEIMDGAKNGMITLFPHLHQCDGFFIAKLKKTKES